MPTRTSEPKSPPGDLELFDADKFINVEQVGGIDAYTLSDGPARGSRALCFNTGGGLRFRVLLDRGMDIDRASYHQHSLAFLTHKGNTPPTRALDRGYDWLKSFGAGLLTTCGPNNTGEPVADGGEELGLHGTHSNTAGTLEAVTQPDPRRGRTEMSAVASYRYGAFYGPNVELRRSITSALGHNTIDICDEFFNAGNQAVPHAWLLHVNFGYPLLDEGAEFCYAAQEVVPTQTPGSGDYFREGQGYKRVPGPKDENRGSTSVVAYLYPRPRERGGRTTVGLVNRKLSLGFAIHYNTLEFPRCVHWLHWGRHEYVAALEPANGGVEGRDKDRASGWMDSLEPGGRKTYRYRFEVVTSKEGLEELRSLNKS